MKKACFGLRGLELGLAARARWRPATGGSKLKFSPLLHDNITMVEKKDTFEELVKSLANSERREMLDRIGEVAEGGANASEAKAAAEKHGGAIADVDAKRTRFSETGVLVRFWFALLAFFSSSTAEEKYNAHLVAELGRSLSQKYGVYFSLSKRMYTDLLYQDLVFLESIRSFFLPYINEYGKHRGDFYILLASLVAPGPAEAISAALDPSSESYDDNDPKELHAALVKRMDEAFDSFPAEDKGRMYQAAQSAEWISSFAELSLNRTILQFSDTAGSGQMCPVDTLTEDFKKLSSVLASAEKIPVRLLEAFFIFMQKDKMQDEAFSFDQECEEFVKKAVNSLAGIAGFRSRIPLADFVRFSTADISWEPEPDRAGEDWFRLFKVAWKGHFEKRFAQWAKLRDKFVLKKHALNFLECVELPPLEYAPWEDSWVKFKFSRQTILLFLKAFFSGVYSKRISRVLRIIMAEGDFYKRENLSEFTDAFNALEHGKQDVAEFESRLAPKGDIGEGFALALAEKKGTLSGKARLERLMATVESDAEGLCTRTLAAMKSLDRVLCGILSVSQDGEYDTLSNLSSIHGTESESFRSEIASVRYRIQECIEIINDLAKQ